MLEKMKNLSKNRFVTLIITLCLSAVLFLSGIIVAAMNRGNDGDGYPSGPQGGDTPITLYLGDSYQLDNGDNTFTFTPNVSKTYTFTISGSNKTVSGFRVYKDSSQTYSSTTQKTSHNVYLVSGNTYEIDIEMYIYSSGYATLSVSGS